eukprot:m.230073 g.230073  ORF g.230073 m.230073 type:complete len:102 (-) comp15995_c1_seq2:91-396(-)
MGTNDAYCMAEEAIDWMTCIIKQEKREEYLTKYYYDNLPTSDVNNATFATNKLDNDLNWIDETLDNVIEKREKRESRCTKCGAVGLYKNCIPCSKKPSKND